MRLGTRILSVTCLLALLMLGLCLAGGAAVAEEEKVWTGEELQARLVDHTYFGAGGKGKNKFRYFYYLNPDGTAVGRSWGDRWSFRTSGTWTIKGDVICSKWSRPEWGAGCYEHFDKGEYTVSRGVSGDNKGRTLLQKVVGKGNVKNLY